MLLDFSFKMDLLCYNAQIVCNVSMYLILCENELKSCGVGDTPHNGGGWGLLA